MKVSQSFEAEEILYLRRGVTLISGRLFPSVLGQSLPPEVLFLEVEYRLVGGNIRILGIRQLVQTEYDRLKRRESMDAKRRDEEAKRLQRSKESQKRKDQIAEERKQEMTPRFTEEENERPFYPDAIRQRSFGDGLEE